MRSRSTILALALAMALPAFAQGYSSSSSTVTSSGSTVQQSTVANANGATSITGTTLTTVDAEADRVLLNQIVAQLAADPQFQGAAIDVQIDSGRVTLNGEARDTNQAENAKEVAQSIAGSANVTSRLTTGRQ